MKILLDECLPVAIRRHLPGHDVYTVGYLGWKGTHNGALLALAASHGFEAFITVDRNLQYQQSSSTLPLPVIVLESKRIGMKDLLVLLPSLLQVLAAGNLPLMVVRVRQ